MAETYTQEEMEERYLREEQIAASLALEGAWADTDFSYIENIFGDERRTPVNKLLLAAGTILLVIVGLTRLQIVNGERIGKCGLESTRYIDFR